MPAGSTALWAVLLKGNFMSINSIENALKHSIELDNLESLKEVMNPNEAWSVSPGTTFNP